MNKTRKTIIRLVNLIGPLPDITPIEKKNILNTLVRIIRDHEHPHKYFTFLDSGAFKSCYSLDTNRKYVIKFVTEDVWNEEFEIPSRAEEDGITNFFIPVHYTKIRVKNRIKYIIIQRRVDEVVYDSNYTSLGLIDEKDYDRSPISDPKTKETLSYDDASSLFSPQEWVQQVITLYGLGTYYHLCDFCYRNNIFDLHAGNLGYIVENDTKYPVIIDW